MTPQDAATIVAKALRSPNVTDALLFALRSVRSSEYCVENTQIYSNNIRRRSCGGFSVDPDRIDSRFIIFELSIGPCSVFLVRLPFVSLVFCALERLE